MSQDVPVIPNDSMDNPTILPGMIAYMVSWNGSHWVRFTGGPGGSSVMSLYQADGDGGAVVFDTSLSFLGDPLVAVGGLLQRKTTDYTIAGGTVTFDEPPPVGTNNVQVWGLT